MYNKEKSQVLIFCTAHGTELAFSHVPALLLTCTASSQVTAAQPAESLRPNPALLCGPAADGWRPLWLKAQGIAGGRPKAGCMVAAAASPGQRGRPGCPAGRWQAAGGIGLSGRAHCLNSWCRECSAVLWPSWLPNQPVHLRAELRLMHRLACLLFACLSIASFLLS